MIRLLALQICRKNVFDYTPKCTQDVLHGIVSFIAKGCYAMAVTISRECSNQTRTDNKYFTKNNKFIGCKNAVVVNRKIIYALAVLNTSKHEKTMLLL